MLAYAMIDKPYVVLPQKVIYARGINLSSITMSTKGSGYFRMTVTTVES